MTKVFVGVLSAAATVALIAVAVGAGTVGAHRYIQWRKRREAEDGDPSQAFQSQ